MPIDPAAEELIQKILDGNATPQETDRLRNLAARDASVDEEFKTQRETADLLSRMTPLEAPPDLHRRIMESLPAAPPVRGTAYPPRRGPGGRFPPYLYAAAAGLAVGIVLGPLMLRWLEQPDPSAIVGTIAPGDRGRPLEEVRIDLSDGAAFVRLLPRDGGCALAIEQESESGVQVAVQFDPGALAVSAFRQEPGRAGELNVAAGRVSWTQDGRRSVTLEFERLVRTGSRIHVTIAAAGGPSFDHVLEVPPS